MSTILIFDDDPEERTSLAEEVTKSCHSATKVALFDGTVPLRADETHETYITRIIEELNAEERIALIVCDKELGRFRKLPGLSANPVSAASTRTGIPFCQYSRQPSPGTREFARFDRLRRWSSDEITLEGLEPDQWAPQVACLHDGFEQLAVGCRELPKEKPSPPAALAQLLDHPESESRIALYGSGAQGFLAETLVYYDPDDLDSDLSELFGRMPRLLGNWLFLSILRFPGILVNKTAAASYLNIHEDAFLADAVHRVFAPARYSGPFHEHTLGPWWWRDELDAIVYGAGCEDGLEYVSAKGLEVSGCSDPETGDPAGYYCMLTRKPVSASNSCGDISWFPAGADLARIRKDLYDRITALVGEY